MDSVRDSHCEWSWTSWTCVDTLWPNLAPSPCQLDLAQLFAHNPCKCKADGIVRYKGGLYVDVGRRSVHECVGGKPNKAGQCVGGFGRERDFTGFYHFVRSTCEGYPACRPMPRGIYLRVGMPVLDYTCPHWVLDATSGYTMHSLPPTRLKFRFTNSTDRVFNRSLLLKCVGGWCTPASSCIQAMRHEFDPWEPHFQRINQPAFWKHDPPLHEHQITRPPLNFSTAIVFWAGHDRKLLAQCRREQSCERSPKVLVDYRKYGVTDASYRNKFKIACPPGHHYHVAQNGRFRPCACAQNSTNLNCAQLAAASEARRDASAQPDPKNVVGVRPAEPLEGPSEVEGYTSYGHPFVAMLGCILLILTIPIILQAIAKYLFAVRTHVRIASMSFLK